MTHSYRELVIGGVLIAPLLSYAGVTIALIVILRPVLHLVGFSNWFSNPPIAELSLYIAIFGLLTLLF
ncbi:hypothetical protein BSZ19_35195 [Bradyrhizobium japonicum]|uniref:DUF1656 domain-containing protein n=1 Tax=Bradyrhizobium japonicum TaxID=375 RepID=A0A1Y2JE29_BRAJP|nr:DUF1656 domain-containing protein [Bradyrhizobium japonicum]OSJ26518.1 hypothetical protein BSZ19_35195 [Bradyrhizobium japonicum]